MPNLTRHYMVGNEILPSGMVAVVEEAVAEEDEVLAK
jgi:hypothetical protein